MPSSSLKHWILSLLVLVVAVGGVAAWLVLRQVEPQDAFASGNGRIEATEVNLATKLAGRLVEVDVEEGDFVDKGQVLARMDTKTLDADLREANAAVTQAEHGVAAAEAAVAQRTSQLKLSTKDLQRYRDLIAQGAVSVQTADNAETQVKTDTALLNAAQAQLAEATAALERAKAGGDVIQTQIDDSTLTAPINSRVLYRLAEPGEVLAAGGAVLTLLDIENVYMTLFLPTSKAGLVDIGAEARIVLDARPDISIPARVSFVSPEAQFTPKSVETQTEREKLMFRVKVRIDPELLRLHAKKVKTGLPGVAYVRLDPDADWPAMVPEVVPPVTGNSTEGQ